MPTTDELAAQLTTLQESTPTLEELQFVTRICCWTNSTQTPVRDLGTANWITLWTPSVPARVLSATLVFEYWNLTASDTNYWKGELAVRGPSTGFNYNTFATRTSQLTGANANGAVTARKAWKFDAAAYTGSADLGPDDSLLLRASPVGSPASDWRLPVSITVRYRPL